MEGDTITTLDANELYPINLLSVCSTAVPVVVPNSWYRLIFMLYHMILEPLNREGWRGARCIKQFSLCNHRNMQ